MRSRRIKRRFFKEFKRQVKYAIAAGCGFLIAYAWKETIWNTAQNIVNKLMDSAKTSINNTSTAIILTAIGVIIILISSRLLRD